MQVPSQPISSTHPDPPPEDLCVHSLACPFQKPLSYIQNVLDNV